MAEALPAGQPAQSHGQGAAMDDLPYAERIRLLIDKLPDRPVYIEQPHGWLRRMIGGRHSTALPKAGGA